MQWFARLQRTRKMNESAAVFWAAQPPEHRIQTLNAKI